MSEDGGDKRINYYNVCVYFVLFLQSLPLLFIPSFAPSQFCPDYCIQTYNTIFYYISVIANITLLLLGFEWIRFSSVISFSFHFSLKKMAKIFLQ